MKTLGKLDLLKRELLKVVQIDLGNDECVYVRQMTAYERDKMEQSMRKETKNAKGESNFELALDNFRAKLAVNCICDEKGELLLQPEDYLTLSKNMSASRMEKIIDKAQELNAITEKDKEALIKNSEADQVGNSSSASAEK